jgi:hypothetical protein
MEQDCYLSGRTFEKNGMFSASITLQTPDGEATTITSGFIFHNKEDAEVSLRLQMDGILKEFENEHDIKIISKTETKLQ